MLSVASACYYNSSALRRWNSDAERYDKLTHLIGNVDKTRSDSALSHTYRLYESALSLSVPIPHGPSCPLARHECF